MHWSGRADIIWEEVLMVRLSPLTGQLRRGSRNGGSGDGGGGLLEIISFFLLSVTLCMEAERKQAEKRLKRKAWGDNDMER